MKLPAKLDSALSFLHGFLKALEIAAGRKTGISVGVYKNTGTLESDLALYLKKCKIKYGAINTITSSRDEFISQSWGQLDILLGHFSSSALDDLKWQFEECIGLLSTAINTNGAFNPLYSNPIYAVELTNSNIQRLHIFEIEGWMFAFFSDNSA